MYRRPNTGRAQNQNVQSDYSTQLQHTLTLINRQATVLDGFYSDLCTAVENLEDLRSQAQNVPCNYFGDWCGIKCSELYDSLTGISDDSLVLYMNSYINEVEDLKDAVNSARSYLRTITYGNTTLGEARAVLDGIGTYIENLIN